MFVETHPTWRTFNSISARVSVMTRGSSKPNALSFAAVFQRLRLAACFMAVSRSIASPHVRLLMPLSRTHQVRAGDLEVQDGLALGLVLGVDDSAR